MSADDSSRFLGTNDQAIMTGGHDEAQGPGPGTDGMLTLGKLDDLPVDMHTGRAMQTEPEAAELLVMDGFMVEVTTPARTSCQPEERPA